MLPDNLGFRIACAYLAARVLGCHVYDRVPPTIIIIIVVITVIVIIMITILLLLSLLLLVYIYIYI